MPDQIQESVKGERSHILMGIAEQLKNGFVPLVPGEDRGGSF